MRETETFWDLFTTLLSTRRHHFMSVGEGGKPPAQAPAQEGLPAGGAKASYYRLRCCAGVPVVAGVSSGIQVILVRSYLNPLAFFKASLVEFITR